MSIGGEGCILLSVSRTTGACLIMQSSDVTIRTAAATSQAISQQLAAWRISDDLCMNDVGFLNSKSLLLAKLSMRDFTVAVREDD